MATIKISSRVEERVWADLKALAAESHQAVSRLLNEALAEYIRRRRVRPAVLAHLEDSMNRNKKLGKLLAP